MKVLILLNDVNHVDRLNALPRRVGSPSLAMKYLLVSTIPIPINK